MEKTKIEFEEYIRIIENLRRRFSAYMEGDLSLNLVEGCLGLAVEELEEVIAKEYHRKGY